jgi:hypothetical protein
MMSADRRWFEYVVAVLPMCLAITILGADRIGLLQAAMMGIAVGGLGAATNLWIVRTELPRWQRIALCLVVTVSAAFVWSVLVGVMS